MKKIIALSISDVHFHDWNQFNEDDKRIKVSSNFLIQVAIRAKDLGVPILFSGDLFHTPKGLSNKTLYKFMELGCELRDIETEFIGISGNHDLDGDYSLFESMSMAFPDVFCCIDNGHRGIVGANIFGIPYLKRNAGLVEKINDFSQSPGRKILMIHTPLYGALDPSGYELEPQNFSRQSLACLKAFDLVLAGHIHKYTKVMDGVHMVGAPYQQRKSDKDCEMGYLQIYDDFSVNFIPYDAPRFRYFKEGEEHDDTNDFWIEIPNPKKLTKHSEASFKPTMNRQKMAIRYAKEVGQKSKSKIKALINILEEVDD